MYLAWLLMAVFKILSRRNLPIHNLKKFYINVIFTISKAEEKKDCFIFHDLKRDSSIDQTLEKSIELTLSGKQLIFKVKVKVNNEVSVTLSATSEPLSLKTERMYNIVASYVEENNIKSKSNWNIFLK